MNALSEARVIVGRYQQITSVDLTESSQIAQGSIDNVVESYLGDGYTGLTVGVDPSATGVIVQPGFLVQGGRAFSLSDAFPLSLASKIATIPAAKTMNVIIVANGDESQSSETRTFEDASKKPTNPADLWPTVQTYVATRMVRTVDVSAIPGTADVSPSDPVFNATLCPIARVVLSNTGVVSVTPITDAKIVRQDQIAATVASLSAYQSTLEGTINGLLSSVAANTLAIKGVAAQLQAAIIDLQNQINALATRTTSSPTATFRGSDNFNDLSQSSPAAPGYNAVVSGGLRFATVTSPSVPLAPTSPYDASLQQGTGSLVYPKITGGGAIRANYSADIYNGTAKITGFQPWNATLQRRGFGRARVRCGINLQAVQANQVLASGDPSQIFAIDPTTFVYDQGWGDWRANNPQITRRIGYWFDLSSRGYWTPVEGTGDTAGLPAISQTVRPQTSCMVTSVQGEGRFAGGAPVRLLVMGDINGNPDPTHVIADVVTTPVPFNGSFLSYPVWTMPYPILHKAGEAYHYVFLSSDSFEFLTYAHGSNQAAPALAGGVQAIVNGAWAPVSAYDSLAIDITTAQFANPNIVIPLPNLNLGGGADTIDLLSKLILPDGCNLDYQVQIGGQWVSLSQVTSSTNPLAGNPNTLPLRLVISGTGAVAPILDTSPAVGRLSKSGVALDHVSAVQTPAAPVTTIHKTVVIDNWQPAVQTLTANLRTGASFATNTAPTSVSADVIQADGSLLRTYTWTLGAAVPSFEMELIGTTTDVSKTFVGRSTSWDAA